MTTFKYDPIVLQGPAFRLLRLLKGHEDPIRCELFQSKLPPAEDYAAISYTWGSAFRPCEVIINEHRMAVTKNAYLALRDVRLREHDRLLWIDTLCIDQSNLAERGEQVQQMGLIYSHAERVLIWLGEPIYDTDYAITCMKELELRIIQDFNGQETTAEQRSEAWSDIVRNLTIDQKEVLADGLRSLLSRDWFKRVWIIQETAHAQRAEIFCGRKSVSAHVFVTMPSLLKIEVDTPKLRHCQSKLDIMPGPLRKSSWWGEARDLRTLFVKFAESEATDPRDMVYALLGISADAENSEFLKADYERSMEDVIFVTSAFFLDFHEIASKPRFFNWTLSDFLLKLDNLDFEVAKCAMSFGYEDVVRPLIARDKGRLCTALVYLQGLNWASGEGHEAVVRLFLESVDDWRPDSFKIPLWSAVEHGHLKIAQLLLENLSTGRTDFSCTGHALYLAAAMGHIQIVKYLLQRDHINWIPEMSTGPLP